MTGRNESLSLVIPVYKNEDNLPRLLAALSELGAQAPAGFEVVFVVDGSPDRSLPILRDKLINLPFRSQLLSLSRNFGSISAVMAGLEAGTGEYFAVVAADLQEPPELALEFLRRMAGGEADIVFGCREKRCDPWLTELLSNIFWTVYRRFVVPDMPKGGVDVFGCTRAVRDRILDFHETNTNLVALLFWVGYRRAYVGYERRERLEGKSAWTLRKKIKYSLDSIFNFTELPIQLLMYTGGGGMIVATLVGAAVLFGRLVGNIQVPGYTPIVLAVLFFGGATNLGLGIIGRYVWLALENIRRRPKYIVQSTEHFRS